MLGGAGNGVQWVAAISAVQELTVQGMQARVMSVLESIGAAMPGVGYLVGGLIASGASPRATFLVAGIGVLRDRRHRCPHAWARNGPSAGKKQFQRPLTPKTRLWWS